MMMMKTCARARSTCLLAGGKGMMAMPGRGLGGSPRTRAQARSSGVVMNLGIPKQLPQVTFHTRIRDESIGGDNPFTWKDVTSSDLFGGKRVVLFSLPGAFTPTCSTYQLPGFEKNFEEFKKLGIDDIYCLSVNDSFVMNKWSQAQDLKHVKVIPDGSVDFTREMKMNVQKDNHGFGQRSWRYAVVAKDMKIEQAFIEPGKCENGSLDDDPYGASSPENILKYLKGEDFDAGE
jgi:peroxiredoxin